MVVNTTLYSQESNNNEDKNNETGNQETTTSNLFTYSPSKLLNKGQWDIKWFNNLYTETEKTNNKGQRIIQKRENYFTSSIDIFTGINNSKTLNLGIILEYRSNTNNGLGVFEVFKFKNDSKQFRRSGLTSIAPSVKFNPLKGVKNFTIQSVFSIPLISIESLDGIFLDQKGYTWQNKFFYDHITNNESFQFFFELNTEYNFGKKDESFANDSFRISPGLFVSYFPTKNFAILALIQHSNLIEINNGFSQNYTAIGVGSKYQLSRIFNFEVIYTNFIRGNDTGLGQTFNFGLRALLE